MVRPADGKAVWDLGEHGGWWNDVKTGAFDLIDFNGLGAPTKTYHPKELAALVGARVSDDSADRGTRQAALFPGPFVFSPNNGKPLRDAPKAIVGAWIPPFGHT